MATTMVNASLDGESSRFVARTGSGHTVVMDNAEGDTGPRPAELLVVAQAGCTAMDVVSILRKKRQRFTRYEIRIVHVVEGPVEVEAVRRAVELSATRYCTVTGNLSSGVTEIHHAYLVHGAGGEESYGEVVVTGPAERPEALSRLAAARSA